MAAQGLGTTGETNPLLSFNVNTFAAQTSTRTEEEEEEEEEDGEEEEEDLCHLVVCSIWLQSEAFGIL